MAATDEGAALTEQHRLTQARIRAQAVTDSVALMALLDVENVETTAPRWIRANERLVTQMRRESEQAALAYLVAFKRAEIGRTDVPWRSVPLDPARLRTSLLVTGPATIRSLSARGIPLRQTMETATTLVAGANSRHALDGGRMSAMETQQRDRTSQGWQRITSATPCAFCAMLASRGPVFKGVSFDQSDPLFAGDLSPTGQGPGGFKAHDHCACSMEPIYRTDSRMVDRATGFRSLWDSVTTKTMDPRDARNTFRRAYEAQLRAAA